MASVQYVRGDDFWLRIEHYAFDVRITMTNSDILSALETITSDTILLEWVPSFGPFVESIRGISEIKEYRFVHIILTAPKAVLEKRKSMRDGNKDLGPVDLEKYETLKNVILFNTSVESFDSIINKCMNVLE